MTTSINPNAKLSQYRNMATMRKGSPAATQMLGKTNSKLSGTTRTKMVTQT